MRGAQQAAFEAVGPGVAAQRVDHAARSVIEAAGFGERFVHRTGHGIGLEVHEAPDIVEGNETPLEVTAGYRFRPRSLPRLRPYIGVGLTSYAYEERSDFDEPGEGLTARRLGVVGVGGLEFRVHKYVGVSADGAVTHVTGILGQAGISRDIGESDLGGISARIRLIIGR